MNGVAALVSAFNIVSRQGKSSEAYVFGSIGLAVFLFLFNAAVAVLQGLTHFHV
jgi:hypothetical protein